MADALATGAALPPDPGNYHFASLYCLAITRSVQSIIQTAQNAADAVSEDIDAGGTVTANAGASGAAVSVGQGLLASVADFYDNSQDTNDPLSSDDSVKWAGIVSAYASFLAASSGVGTETLSDPKVGGFSGAIDSIGNAFAKTARGLASTLDYGIVAAIAILLAGLVFYIYTKVKK